MLKKICFVLVLFIIVGCGEQEEILMNDVTNDKINEYFSERDFDNTYDFYKVIDLNDDKVIVDEGIGYSDNKVTISTEGSYLIKGESVETQIIIDCSKESKVQLIFDNISMKLNESVIVVEQCDKVFITMVDDSLNTLSSFLVGDDLYYDAVIFSKEDLTINGNGSLLIEGDNSNGITSKDELRIIEGNYVIDVAKNGLEGNDYIKIANGEFDITGNNGIKCDNSDDLLLGNLYVENGFFKLNSMNNGLNINGDIEIVDGEFLITSQQDGIHSNSNIVIYEGNYVINVEDDGIHADNNLTILGGTLNLASCYEGLEGKSIDIHGGDIDIYCNDDGINAAGSYLGEEGVYINVTGGNINIDGNFESDGFDSNGDITISGGIIMISGTTDTRDTVLDYDNNGTISGGIFIATGSSGMTTQNFDTNSTQSSILILLDEFQDGEIILYDDSGSILYEFTPVKTYQSILISAPYLSVGNSYVIKTPLDYYEITLENYLYTEGSISGGTQSFGNDNRIPVHPGW